MGTALRWLALAGLTFVLAAAATFAITEASDGGGDDSPRVAPAGATEAGGTGMTGGRDTPGGAETTRRTETSARVDVSGPCDEPEHASDSRCTGAAPPQRPARSTVAGVDVSGPCDEPEHAGDPRCAPGGDHRGGRGRGRSGSGKSGRG